MKYLILVSHGEYAKGLKTSLQMFAGAREDVIAVGLEDGKTADDFAGVFTEAVSALTDEDEVVVLADIVGGSPLTTALNVLGTKGLLAKAQVFGGMNLSMALTAVLMKDNGDPEGFAAGVLEEGKGAVQQFVIATNDEEDDI